MCCRGSTNNTLRLLPHAILVFRVHLRCLSRIIVTSGVPLCAGLRSLVGHTIALITESQSSHNRTRHTIARVTQPHKPHHHRSRVVTELQNHSIHTITRIAWPQGSQNHNNVRLTLFAKTHKNHVITLFTQPGP